MENKNTFRRIIDKISAILATISGISLAMVMLLFIIGFIGRYFSKPIYGVGVLAVFVMVAVVYLGQSFCEKRRGHVNVDIVLNLFPSKIKKVIKVMNYLIAFITASLIFYSSWDSMIKSYVNSQSVAGVVSFPIYPVRIAITFGMLFFVLQVGAHLYDEIKS